MTLPQPALDALQAAFGERLLIDEPLSRHSSALTSLAWQMKIASTNR